MAEGCVMRRAIEEGCVMRRAIESHVPKSRDNSTSACRSRLQDLRKVQYVPGGVGQGKIVT